MKKLIAVSILLTLLATAAFAQFKASATVEFQGDILRTAAPLDDARDTSKTNPLSGGSGYEKRYFNFLSSMDYWNGSEIKFELTYKDPDNKDDPKYGAFLQVNADWMWQTLTATNIKTNVTLEDRIDAVLQALVTAETTRGNAKAAWVQDQISRTGTDPRTVLTGGTNSDGSPETAEDVWNRTYDTANPTVTAIQAEYEKAIKTKGTSPNTIVGILQSAFGDWNVWGRVGILKGFVGNTDNRGATKDARGAHYNDYMDNFKFEPLGIMKMATITGAAAPTGYLNAINWDDFLGGGTGYLYAPVGGKEPTRVTHNDVDMSDLRMEGGNTYVSIEADLAPVTVAIAGDLTGVANKVFDGTLSNANDSHTSIGAAFRISGDVLDMLKFDAIYKITGGELITDENQSGFYYRYDVTTGKWVVTTRNVSPQPDDNGDWLNRFGLFGNVNLLNNTLGLTAGYSGEFRVRENDRNKNSYVYPYYSGIDLRASFSGIDKLNVSLNNNVSFAYIRGASNKTNVVGITGRALDDAKKSDGYFGMYNALLVDFNLTEDLLASFQVGNRLYSTTFTETRSGTSDYTSVLTADELQLTAGAFYSLGSKVTLGSGLAFNLYHQTLVNKDENDVKAGYFTFGIPLTAKVVF